MGNSQLPMTLKIAAGMEALDKITVEPINNFKGVDFKTISVFSFLANEEKIEDKFVKKAIDEISDDIVFHLENYEDCIFKPFSLRGKIRRGVFFSHMDVGYLIEYKDKKK